MKASPRHQRHFRAHLHLATAMRLQCHCDVAPNCSQSDSSATLQSLGVTVQHQNNRLDLGAMTQQCRSDVAVAVCKWALTLNIFACDFVDKSLIFSHLLYIAMASVASMDTFMIMPTTSTVVVDTMKEARVQFLLPLDISIFRIILPNILRFFQNWGERYYFIQGCFIWSQWKLKKLKLQFRRENLWSPSGSI